MMKQLSVALAAGILAAGVSVAAAAPAPANAHMAPPVKNTLTLTKQQRKMAWRDLSNQRIKQTAPASSFLTVGQRVPSTTTLRPVTAKAAQDVPALKPYDFTMAKGELVIVNPSTKKIVEVIRG
jgi:Protein of unknown function (DUF1236)